MRKKVPLLAKFYPSVCRAPRVLDPDSAFSEVGVNGPQECLKNRIDIAILRLTRMSGCGRKQTTSKALALR